MCTFLLLSLLLLLNACSDLGYYWHTANGHMTLMNKRIDIDVMLEDPELEPKLRERLQLVKEIRDFSVGTLSLPELWKFLPAGGLSNLHTPPTLPP